MHSYHSNVYVIGCDGRSAGPRALVSTVSGVIARAPRRAPSQACVFSDEELTSGSRLLLHCSRTRCVVLDNESILACECEISMGNEITRAFSLRTAAHRTGESSQHMFIESPTTEKNGLELTRDFLFWQAVHALSMSVRLDFPSRGRSGTF